MPRTLWFDVEDIFHYVRNNSRPSGIQRVTFETYRALQRCDDATERARFVRHTADGKSLVIVSWSELEAVFTTAMSDGEQGDQQSALGAPEARNGETAPMQGWRVSPARAAIRRVIYRLPARFRQPLVLFLVLQVQAALALLQCLPRAASLGLDALAGRTLAGRTGRTRPAAGPGPAAGPLESLARPGDFLIVLGSPWFHADYAALVQRMRDRSGIRLAVLVHDIIPLRHPEWCHHGVVQTFRDWHASVLPLCDVLFANSRATAADLGRHAAEAGIRLPGRIQPVPVGSSFGATPSRAPAKPETLPARAKAEALPAPGSYVLFVATIEARKNHVLAFRIWRQLTEDLPPEQVPTLVFAGRVGWLVADLMQQLENANWLDGRIRFIPDPSDAELQALYRGCQFTLFPSLYEGWGLPVTESLAFGRPCIASNRTSLPEAGGTLARYFDPEDFGDAYRAVRATIEDQAGLAAWQQRVAREFRPVPWEATAQAIIARLDAFDAPAVTPPT